MTLWKLLIGSLLAMSISAVFAQGMPGDAAGTKDHPNISRYAGSWLYAGEERDFDEVTLPAGEGKTVRIEGSLTRLLYLSPPGKTTADVHRNYQAALERASATRIDSCAENCRSRNFKALVGDANSNKKQATPRLEGYSVTDMLQYGIENDAARYWYGTLQSPSGLLHIVIYTGRPGLIAHQTKYVSTLVMVVQEKPLETGKVQVDAKAMASGLHTDGKIALYGLYFDTGKSEIKPESKQQLDEMAKLLQGDPRLNVFIVGHTDNQGRLESNLVLSRARAQSVIDTLVRNYKIDAKRLAAGGVANYSPVASNSAEPGRAKNRRVELVLQ
ncbi:MAG: OmpA family protein [Pseudomonadota bacterium]